MKKSLAYIAMISIAAGAFAYNPPVGGSNLFKVTNPELISGAASVVGGPLSTVVPASITYNPALSANEQRIGVDLSGTFLINTNPLSEDDKKVGFGFQAGGIIPTKFLVVGITANGLFSGFDGMNLRDTLVLHTGISKEINERLSVGLNLYTGFYMGSDSDFSVGADLGALYKLDDFAIFKSPRIGAALLNLGKPANGYTKKGLYEDRDFTDYPAFITPKVGFGAELFRVKKITGAFSADMSFPTCQNFVLDLAYGMSFADIVEFSVAWQNDLREVLAKGSQGLSWPSVGLNFRLVINSSKISGKNEDWAKSEIIPSFAWQNMYTGIQAISAGARMNLGMADTKAPEIFLWDEE